MTCRMMLVKTDKGKIPEFAVTLKGNKEMLKVKKTKGGHLEFMLRGDDQITIDWK